MVVSTTAGSTNYKIYLSASYSGAAGSEAPDGATVYFFCEDWSRPIANLIKPKISIGQAIYVPSNKYSIEITLKNAWVAPQSATTATTEADAIDHFLYTYSIKRGAPGMYLFIYSEAESQYKKLSWNTSGTQLRYLKCAIDGWDLQGQKGKIYLMPSLKFLMT